MVSVPCTTLMPPSSSTATSERLGRKLSCVHRRARASMPSRLVVSQQAGLVLESLLHQRHAAEGFDDPDAGGHLFDDRGQVALLVLEAARDDLVLVVEPVAEVGDRQHAGDDDERQLPVQAEHQDEDDGEGHDRLQEPDQAEAHEAAHGGDVGDGSRQQLARLPVVVEGDLQVLQVRVEVVAQVGLHAQRRDARVVAPQEDEDELEQRRWR